MGSDMSRNQVSTEASAEMISMLEPLENTSLRLVRLAGYMQGFDVFIHVEFFYFILAGWHDLLLKVPDYPTQAIHHKLSINTLLPKLLWTNCIIFMRWVSCLDCCCGLCVSQYRIAVQ